MGVDLIQQGVDLMLYGMGTVFAFLTLLVGAIYLMSSIISRFFPDPVVEEAMPVLGPAVIDPQLKAVIQAAIDQHRGA